MNRKEMIRKYKETPRPMGVYAVRNTANGDIFIGRSVDLPAILNRHRFGLEMGSHRNGTLQQQWDASGGADLEFEVLDTLEPDGAADYDPSDDLECLEQVWIERIEQDGARAAGGTVRKA